jgi:hypothetical protein
MENGKTEVMMLQASVWEILGIFLGNLAAHALDSSLLIWPFELSILEDSMEVEEASTSVGPFDTKLFML